MESKNEKDKDDVFPKEELSKLIIKTVENIGISKTQYEARVKIFYPLDGSPFYFAND